MSFDLIPSICQNIGIYTNNNDIDYVNENVNDSYYINNYDSSNNKKNHINYSILDNNIDDNKIKIKNNNTYVCQFTSPFMLFAEPVKKKMTIPLLVLVGINTQSETAKMRIVMEKKCPYGLYCPHKTNPMMCPYNHHETPDVINIGDVIPSLLCRYERPWKKQQNSFEPLICMNPNCWYNHGQGRAERLHQSNYYKYEES
jgi:hypothetical protein